MQNFQMLIVSSVKICKQCLQTASATGGVRPWSPRGTSVPRPSGYSPPPMKIPFAATVYFTRSLLFSYKFRHVRQDVFDGRQEANTEEANQDDSFESRSVLHH